MGVTWIKESDTNMKTSKSGAKTEGEQTPPPA
jgi:hypothetical protein